MTLQNLDNYNQNMYLWLNTLKYYCFGDLVDVVKRILGLKLAPPTLFLIITCILF